MRAWSAARSLGLARPVNSATRIPADASSWRKAIVVLPREDFGRRHQGALTAGLDDARHGERRDDRLAGSDVALHKPQHAFVRGEIGADFVERALLRARQAKGQGGFDPAGEAAVAFVLATGLDGASSRE